MGHGDDLDRQLSRRRVRWGRPSELFGSRPLRQALKVTVRVVSVFAFAALAVAPLTATAQSLPAKAVVFEGDFETGNLSQWSWGAQCANTGVPSDASNVSGTVI